MNRFSQLGSSALFEIVQLVQFVQGMTTFSTDMRRGQGAHWPHQPKRIPVAIGVLMQSDEFAPGDEPAGQGLLWASGPRVCLANLCLLGLGLSSQRKQTRGRNMERRMARQTCQTAGLTSRRTTASL